MLSRRRLLQLILPAAVPSGWRLGAEDRGGGWPYLQNVGSDRASICWMGVEPGTATVESVGEKPLSRPPQIRTTEITLPQRDRLFLNEAVVDGLTPGEEYLYSVSEGGAKRFRFRTPATGSARLIVFGDSGSGSEEQQLLASRMLSEKPDLALHTGDLAYPIGTQDAYRALYFAPYRDLMSSTPFYPCLGNHDYVDDAPDAYRALMRVPSETVPAEGLGLYYSFDWGETHFVSLDTNAPLSCAAGGSGDMLNWLDGDLQRSKARWKIVFFHHAPYATGNHEEETQPELVRRFVVPILERHGVRLVFAGHEHSYQRTHPLRGGVVEPLGGTVYVTTGGGGGGLYPAPASPLQAVGRSEHHFVTVEIDGDRLEVRTAGLDGTLLDSFSVTAC